MNNILVTLPPHTNLFKYSFINREIEDDSDDIIKLPFKLYTSYGIVNKRLFKGKN